MPVVDVRLPAALLKETQVADPLDLGMVAQPGADLRRIFARPAHPQFERLETAQQHPSGVRIGDGAHDVARRADRADRRLRPDRRAGDQIRMAADIFGQAIDHQVCTMAKRLLPQRPEESVVHHDQRTPIAGAENRLAGGAHGRDIDQTVRGIRRAFEEDQRHARRRRAAQHGFDLVPGSTCREIEPGHAQPAEQLADQRLGGGVKRCRMDNDIARPDMGEQGRRDRGHARGERQRGLRLFPDGEPPFEDLLIGTVEPAIDQGVGLGRAGPGQCGKMALARSRAFEGECRGEKDRRLECPFGQDRVIAVPHHQRRWPELVAFDFSLVAPGAPVRADRARRCIVRFVHSRLHRLQPSKWGLAPAMASRETG